MARVIIGRGDAYHGNLPPICMKCGADAAVYRTKMFSLSPFGVPLIILPFWMAISPGRIWIRGPFCEAHKNYWRWRLFWMSVGPVAALFLGAGGMALITSSRPQDLDALRPLVGLLCFGSVVLLFIWTVGTLWFQYTGIRLDGHTPSVVTLAGVSETFAEAVGPSPPNPYRRG